MIELDSTDTRKLALEDPDALILIACEITMAAGQGGTHYFNGSSNEEVTLNSNIYVPNIVQSIRPPKIESGVGRGIFEARLVDIDNTYYNKILGSGITGVPIRIGYFWFHNDAFTDILWRYVGKIVGLTRNKDLTLIQAASFLASIDNFHTVVATHNSQQTRDKTDTSQKYIDSAKLHKFGGASRD